MELVAVAGHARPDNALEIKTIHNNIVLIITIIITILVNILPKKESTDVFFVIIKNHLLVLSSPSLLLPIFKCLMTLPRSKNLTRQTYARQASCSRKELAMVPAVLVSHYALTYRLYVTQAPALLLASAALQHKLQNTLSFRTATYDAMIWLLEISSLT